MYYQHYGLIKNPFSLAPDPRFLFLGEVHKEALATLHYGILEGKDFIVLTGEPGTGKTLLLNVLKGLLSQRRKLLRFPGDPLVGSGELQRAVLKGLGGHASPNTSEFQVRMRIGRSLVDENKAGRKVVLVIDEAQTLRPEVLERLRLLTNFETPEQKLLQVVLVGQPGLAETINQPDLAQLKQRTGLWCRLSPLSREEVAGYIAARLAKAGRHTDGLFTSPAIDRIAVLSQGIPRLINVLCDNALLLGFAGGVDRIEPPFVDRAARELSGMQNDGREGPRPDLASSEESPGAPEGTERRMGWAKPAVFLLTAIAGLMAWVLIGWTVWHRFLGG